MYIELVGTPKVTPGTVAANPNGLTPGDVILKIGNVNATNIPHNEAQEVICGASNILQLTIKRGAAPVSPTSPGSQNAPSYQSSGPFSPKVQQQQQSEPNWPDYRIGSGYQGSPTNANDSRGGYTSAQQSSPNNAYDMRQFEQTPPISGYSTLPARSGNRQTNDGFRPVQTGQQEQQKYPYSSSAGIQLQSVARNPVQDGSYSQPMSPVQYNGNRNIDNSQYQRQPPTVGQNQTETNTGHQPSHFRKPTPFQSGYNYNQNGSATLPLQRQTSSGQSSGNVYGSTISPGFQAGSMLPKSDDAPPPPPPPTNYSPYDHSASQAQYQRQTSQNQQNNYGGSPYEQQQNAYNSYQSRPNQGGYEPQPNDQQYQRQGSRPYEYNTPPQQQPGYQRQPSNPQSNYYDDRNRVQSPQQFNQYSSPQQQSYNRQPPPVQQPQYGRQSSREQQAPSGYSPVQPQFNRQPSQPNQPQYNRQPSQPVQRQSSREQHNEQPHYSHPTSPPGNAINSFDDILSPFENFQNSNYCDKLFARSPENRGDVDSGVSMSSDTPRSNQSSTYSPPQPYGGGYESNRGEVAEQQNLLRPAPPAPPPPALTPPPPPPPPPPTDWNTTPKKKIPLESGPKDIGGQESMPDKVLNTMIKNKGTQKPFAYVPTGADLKEFRERARARRQPRNVMPKGLQSFEQDDLPGDEPKRPIDSVASPDSGVYKHAQYNSPLRMYSSGAAKEAFNVQTGGAVDVAGVNNSTPERRPSDIKDSEVYKMCQAADAQGKQPKKPRDPLLRHNSVDDEMRFSGFHTKADIPSKAFQRLNKMAGAENDTNESPKSKKSQQDRSDEDNEVGYYDQASIRYKGNYIPSPSFRLLQTLAKEDNSSPYAQVAGDSSDDGLPDRLSEEDMIDKRRQGTNPPPNSNPSKGNYLSVDGGNKPGSDNESGGKTNRSKSPVVPPKPMRTEARSTPPVKAVPSTDF